MRRDLAKARHWYKKAARRGEPKALFSLGQLAFDRGELTMAAGWFRKGARQRHARSLYYLGRLHLFGLGVEQDTRKGAQLLRDAALRGVGPAKRLIASARFDALTRPRLARSQDRRIERMARLKHQFRRGSPVAANNIAVSYRELGDFRRAFQWWRRAAKPNDGDAWLEVGYSLQYGLGVRRDPNGAIRAYRRAIDGRNGTQHGQEEAQYHLAVALLDMNPGSLLEPVQLLSRASADKDYAQANGLLRHLRAGKTLTPCRCRRSLARRFGGKAQCPLHRSASKQTVGIS